jgi:hypothetical protein
MADASVDPQVDGMSEATSQGHGTFPVALAGGEATWLDRPWDNNSIGPPPAFGATGEPLSAAKLFGAADSLWLASGSKRYPFDDVAFARDLRGVQAQLDDATFASAVGEGGQ